jgi:HAD superfamily hydrolase (TIGR01662 family)
MAQFRSLRAVLFDRDGTLIRDVPYNGEPDRVEPMPTARLAVDLVRRRGLRTGVVTNQSGVARGLITSADVARVNARVDAVLGPFDVWAVCEHGAHDGCDCRKPAPGLILRASAALGVACAELVVVGDIGADVSAARAAGAAAVLVPTPVTRPDEVASAPVVARDLLDAVRRALRGEVVG